MSCHEWQHSTTGRALGFCDKQEGTGFHGDFVTGALMGFFKELKECLI